MRICSGCRRHVRVRDMACPFCGVAAAVLGAAVLLAACADRPVDETQTGTTAGPAESSEGSSGGTSVPTSSGTSAASSSGGSSSGSTSTSAGESSSSNDVDSSPGAFYGAPIDMGTSQGACDPYVQDCPRGEKCVPWADDGGSSWNALKCVPVMTDAALLGEPCVAEPGLTGVDNCGAGLVCWDLDAQSMGTCTAQCTGTFDEPVCADGTVCGQFNDGALDLCLVACDPVMSDCAPEQVCVPVPSGTGFLCVLDGSADGGQVHGSCDNINGCDVGLLCAAETAAVECDQDAFGCCEPFCDTTVPNPDMQCMGAGQVCVPFFEGEPPQGFEHVGFCSVPP